MKKMLAHLPGRRCLFPMLLLLCFTTAAALDPPWLDEFPNLERINADNETGDRFDDLARQAGIVRQLREAINILAGQRRWDNQLTADETRLINDYWAADSSIQEQAETIAPKANSGSGESQWTKWYLQASRYELDDELRAQTVGRYFSPDTLRQLGYADSEHAALAARGAAQLNEGFGLKPKTRWGKQTPEQKAETILVIGILVVLTLPSLYRESRGFGLVKGDPHKLRAGFRRYELHWISGAVANFASSTETERTTTTTRYSDGSTGWKQSVVTTKYESFDLVGDQGTQHISLTNSKIRMTNGHLVSAVWASRKSKSEGPYILLLDRTAGEFQPIKIPLWRIFKVRYWIMVPLLLLSSWLAVTTEIYEFVGGGGLSASGQMLMAPFVGWVILLILFFWIASRRTRRFVKRDGDRLLAAIEEDEVSVPAK